MHALEELKSIVENKFKVEDMELAQNLIEQVIREWSEDDMLLEYIKSFGYEGLESFWNTIMDSEHVQGSLKAKLFMRFFNSFFDSYLDKEYWWTRLFKTLESIDLTDRIFIMSSLLERQKINNLEEVIDKYIYQEVRKNDFSNQNERKSIIQHTGSAHEVIFNSIVKILIEKLNDPACKIEDRIEILYEILYDKKFRHNLKSLSTPPSTIYNEFFESILNNTQAILVDGLSKSNIFLDFLKEIGEVVFTEENFAFVLKVDYEQFLSNEGLFGLMETEACLSLLGVLKKTRTPEECATYNVSNVSDEHLNNLTCVMLAQAYKSKSNLFHQFIYINEEKYNFSNDLVSMERPQIDVIYNNDGYLPKVANPEYILGNALNLEDERQTPIGYNIHLPQGEIRQAVVEIYGGFKPKDLERHAYQPGALTDVDFSLLKNGTAVFKLNLNDFIDLDVFQDEMPDDVHIKLHQCINKFYDTIQKDPTYLHSSLDRLKNLPVYLKGASFGGKIAIRHAELYPYTFNGYISHDGLIDDKKQKQSKSTIRGNSSPTNSPWLDPALPENLKNLSDPMLIMQNLDDSNVNAKVAFSFINKAEKSGKLNLITLHTEEIGNPIPHHYGIHNKGHFEPKKNEPSFNSYVNELTSFMQGRSESKMMLQKTSKKSYKSRKIANKFYASASPIKRFVAEGMLLYSKSKDKFENLAREATWGVHYQPIADAHFFFEKVNTNKDTLTQEINRLKNDNLLGDEVLRQVIKKEAPFFLKFFEEFYSIKLPLDIEPLILENKNFIEVVRNCYYSLPIENTRMNPTELIKLNLHRLRLLTTLYETNPEILPELSNKYSDYEDTIKVYRNKLTQSIFELETLRRKADDEILINNSLADTENTSEVVNVPVVESSMPPFLKAALKGDVNEIKSLLSEGVSMEQDIIRICDLQQNNHERFYMAETLRLLLKYRTSKITESASSAICLASNKISEILSQEKINYHDLEACLEQGGVVSQKDFNALSDERAYNLIQCVELKFAIKHNHIKEVERLITHGYSANIENKSGNTPLITAIYFGRLDIVKLLIEKGANLEHIAQHEQTPLSMAEEFIEYNANGQKIHALIKNAIEAKKAEASPIQKQKMAPLDFSYKEHKAKSSKNVSKKEKKFKESQAKTGKNFRR